MCSNYPSRARYVILDSYSDSSDSRCRGSDAFGTRQALRRRAEGVAPASARPVPCDAQADLVCPWWKVGISHGSKRASAYNFSPTSHALRGAVPRIEIKDRGLPGGTANAQAFGGWINRCWTRTCGGTRAVAFNGRHVFSAHHFADPRGCTTTTPQSSKRLSLYV